MPHIDKQTQDQIEVKTKWAKYINPTKGEDHAYGACAFGDYMAVVGEVRWARPYMATGKPYVALLRKSDGSVVKEWTGRELELDPSISIISSDGVVKEWTSSKRGVFENCISIYGKLYAVGATYVGGDFYGLIYVFNANLNNLEKITGRDPSFYTSLAYDGKALLYIGGWAQEDANGDGRKEWVWLVEKRGPGTLSLIASKNIYLDSWIDGRTYDIGVEPSTGRIWAVGGCLDSSFINHSLIVVLDSDLRVLKVIDYPDGSEEFLGQLYSIAFDGGQYVYVSGDEGVVKFSVDGELVAINRDGMRRAKIVYGYGYLYAFGGDEIEGYQRHVLYIHDTSLNIVKRYVLSENVNADSYFNFGRPTLEGNNIYVAGYDYVPGKDDSRIVVYSLSLEGVTAATTAAVTTKVPTAATVARIGLEKARVTEELIVRLLSSRVSELQSGYGCLGGYKPKTVNLPRDVVPEGFDGEWVCCLLGCGGWGCAYRCGRSGEAAVFKVPRGFESIFESGGIPTVNRKLLERVVEEANTIKALKHPNILRLYAVSTSAPILVYEYADYGSLEWQLSKGWKPELKDILLIAVQIGDALRYIHSRGLLHGDIKAGNIFIAGGVAKLGDFSTITKLLATTSSHSRFAYTPGWRAPEQAYSDLRRKAKERGLEQRIDVYQLGNLILYMLTGETLDGEDAVEEGKVAEAVKSVEHEKIREILMETLQPEPWNRISSEEVVKNLLEVYKSI